MSRDVQHNEERLQKILAAAGIASRRKAEELILAGRVQVNGQTVTRLGAKADAAEDHIRVDGRLLNQPGRPRYFMLNKPRGVVTTVSDPQGRPTVMKFLPRGSARVFPVGRLDYQSEGLLLLTNDGALANALTNAASRVEKAYLVKVSGRPSADSLEQLRHGIMIEKGRHGHHEGRVMTQPARITLVRDAENPWYEVVLVEGINREIRKMFEEVGHFVEKIRRVRFGPLILDLALGEIRELTAEEVAQLRKALRARPRAREDEGAVHPTRLARRQRQGKAAPHPARRNSKSEAYR
jgi:23S rRNA pseudouridine2605 synthase